MDQRKPTGQRLRSDIAVWKSIITIKFEVYSTISACLAIVGAEESTTGRL